MFLLLLLDVRPGVQVGLEEVQLGVDVLLGRGGGGSGRRRGRRRRRRGRGTPGGGGSNARRRRLVVSDGRGWDERDRRLLPVRREWPRGLDLQILTYIFLYFGITFTL